MILGLVERYIFKAIFPYFLFAASFLSAILLFQQISRFSSTYSSTFLTTSNLYILVYALLPKTLAFALPVSALIGVLLGISRLKSESEIVVMQSSGISDLKLLKPVLIFSLFICMICSYLNLYLSPDVLSGLRARFTYATQQEITSAISVGTFNTELKNLNIYIKEGNADIGEWKGLFITKDEGGFERVITANTGVLDFDGNKAELVLKDVTSVRYPRSIVAGEASVAEASIVTERLKYLRIEVANDLSANKNQAGDSDKVNYEEMSTNEMLSEIYSRKNSDSKEITVQLQRRAALSFSPFVLAVLGFVVGLSFGRSGKALGLVASLILITLYYVLFLAGEQLSRSGFIPVYISGWLANLVFVTGVFLLRIVRMNLRLPSFPTLKRKSNLRASYNNIHTADLNVPADSVRLQAAKGASISPGFMGQMDKGILFRACFVLAMTYMAFISLFLTFTFFELWKSIFANKIGFAIVGKYLLFLLPLVTVQVLGPCVMVAGFVTYLLAVNRNEVVVWLASGTSIYRLILSFALIVFAAVSLQWWVQENLMPGANILQDSLRSQIKNGYPMSLSASGRQWLALKGHIFNYEYNAASSSLKEPRVYFVDESNVLRKIMIGKEGKWNENGALYLHNATNINLPEESKATVAAELPVDVILPVNYFSTLLTRPFYLSSGEIRNQIQIAQGRGEDASQLSLAYHKRYSDLFLIVVFALFGICTSLIFGKSRKPLLQILTIIALGICVILITQLIINAGVYLGLPFLFACWLPNILFTAIGIYMLALLKT